MVQKNYRNAYRKAAVRRTIKIGRFCRPTTSADKNRPWDIKNRPIFDER